MKTGFRYIEGGATLSYDPEKCVGCGYCAVVCPRGVMALEHDPYPGAPCAVLDCGNDHRIEPGKSGCTRRKARVIDHGLCIECGACMANCPNGAILVDKGVGCALAMIIGWLRGTEPDCGQDCCGEGGQ